jgi:hypothetical protein
VTSLRVDDGVDVILASRMVLPPASDQGARRMITGTVDLVREDY